MIFFLITSFYLLLLQELPKAEALQGREANDIENLEKDLTKKETVKESETESQSNDENDESEEMNHVQIKLPTGLQLGDIANAILETNQKSRMNCVVERRRSEEFVDTPAKTVQLPFGLNIKTEPKKQKLTGERMVIVCESKTGEREEEEAEPSIRQFIMPMHPVPLQYGPRGPQFPLTHMPQQMQPQQQMIHQIIPQMQQIPPQFMAQHPQQQQIPQQQQQPPIPATMMQAPRPEQQEVRIQLHRVQIPIQVQNREFPMQVQNRDYPIQQENKDMEPNVQLQQVPLAIALQRAGITAEDLSNIQRMAEARIQEELQQLSSNDDSSDSEESSEEEDSEQQQQPQILQINRMGFGRSLHTPIRIPVPMMESIPESERPHCNY